MMKILYSSKSSPDEISWKHVALVLLAVFTFGTVTVVLFLKKDYAPMGTSICMTLMSIFYPLIPVFEIPSRLVLTDTHLIAIRPVKDITIDLQSIQSVRLLTPEEIRGINTKWMSRRWLGHYCIVETRTRRKFLIATRRRTQWMLVGTSDKLYVFGPDDTRFIDAVNEQIQKIKSPEETLRENIGNYLKNYDWVPKIV